MKLSERVKFQLKSYNMSKFNKLPDSTKVIVQGSIYKLYNSKKSFKKISRKIKDDYGVRLSNSEIKRVIKQESFDYFSELVYRTKYLNY